jgi:hypothetical protein
MGNHLDRGVGMITITETQFEKLVECNCGWSAKSIDAEGVDLWIRTHAVVHQESKQTSIKITKKTQEDLYGAFDTYDAEVEMGSYKADLWNIDEANTLLINGAEGAAMFLGMAHGELMNCDEAMINCWDSKDYGQAYRAHARITKVMEEVFETYKDQLVSEYYGCWSVIA